MKDLGNSRQPAAERLRATECTDPNYKAFLQACREGAACHDMFMESPQGYGAREWYATVDPILIGDREESAAREFERIRLYARSLVQPLDTQFHLAGKRVLDFGCGTGALAVALAASGAKVSASDPTPASLRACLHRARYFGVPDGYLSLHHVQPQHPLPFADCSHDLVVAHSVLEFISKNREDCVHDLLRILVRGGHLIVTGSNGWFPRDYYSGMWLPRLRRSACRRRNLPFGPTWNELRRWAVTSSRKVVDITNENTLNGIDLEALSLRVRGMTQMAAALTAIGMPLKALGRAISIPIDLMLPRMTVVLRVDD